MPGALSEAMAALRQAAPEGFFVGGCVRDWLLGRPLKDLDVAVPGSVEGAGRAAAAALGGVFFWLREAMQVGRVLVRAGSPLQIDLVPLAGTLEEDLRRRDFTVNAMAVSTRDGLVSGAPVIDPTEGRVDLAQRQLRLAAPDALERDPLRCLRAFRLRARLGLTFAAGLEAEIRAAADGLAEISGERIRDELFVLLEEAQGAGVMAELLAHDLVAPWSAELAASAAAAGVPRLAALDDWLSGSASRLENARDLEMTLGAPVTPPRTRRALVRLAALATGAGAAAAGIGHSLCLSAEEIRVLARAVQGAAALADMIPARGSERLRFCQRWEPGAVEAALLALAGDDEVRSGAVSERRPGTPKALTGLLSDLLDRRLRPAPPLLTGGEVMAICALPPGPEVGRRLQEIAELRADGRLSTAEEARAWLREQCRA